MREEPYAALGRRLRAIRRELEGRLGRAVSQKGLGDRLYEIDPRVNPTQPLVSKWEAGKVRPGKAALAAYAGLAGEDPRRLLYLAGYGYAEADLPVPSASPAPQAARGRRLGLRWAVGLVALLGAIGAASYWARGGDPTGATVREGRLEVLSAGRPVWSRELGADSLAGVEPLVCDLDGDGRNKVLASFDPKDDTVTRSGRLVAFSPEGRVRWCFIYGREIAVGAREFTPVFVASHLRWIETAQGPRVPVVARHQNWFPAQVALLDPMTGAAVAEYWHPGFIEAVATFDVGADGREELLLGGINNPGEGPGRPSLAVLDLPFTPARGPDEVFGIAHAQEKAYLLFPRPDVYDAASELAMVVTLSPQLDGRLLATVTTGSGGSIYYYLDQDLEVADFLVSDAFVNQHDRVLGHRYSPAEREAWRVIRRFPRAPDANEPRVP